MTVSTTRVRNAAAEPADAATVDPADPYTLECGCPNGIATAEHRRRHGIPEPTEAVRYEIVDLLDKAATAAWRSGIHPSVIAHVDQVRSAQNDDSVALPCTCPDGRPCCCTAESVDPLD